MQGPYREIYDGIQLSIESKKLRSGKCQIKFQTYGLLKEGYYGYLLTEDGKSLKEIIMEIKSRLRVIGDPGAYYQRNLFSIAKRETGPDDIMIFKG
jgi:hypothetical protein